ncbi:cytochrome P450 [Xylariales sp. PMI_506]|nr:cytochrome P450 [Xylariales sp. PMI_506]
MDSSQFKSTTSAYAGLFLFVVILMVAYSSSWIEYFALPSSIPSPGQGSDKIIRRVIAHTKTWLSGHAGLLKGYNEHSKAGRPFIVPNPSLTPDIMLPREYQKWLVSLPDGVLSQRVANVESYALDHLFPSVDMHNEVMINVVKRYMSGRIGVVQSAMYEQMREVIDTWLGGSAEEGSKQGRRGDEGWREVNLSLFVRDVVLRTGYRVHVGSELCRDEAFIRASWGMTFWAGVGTMIIGQFSPPLLKWPLGLLCSLPITRNIRKYRRIIYPVLRGRLDDIARAKADPVSSTYEPPEDAMTWTAQQLLEKNPDGETLEGIIDNFMAIFTAAFATIPVTIHVMLNLMGLPEAQAYLPLLRAEIEESFAGPDDWTDAHTTAPGRMPLLEAFLRESMRHTPFFARGQEHKVLAPGGIELPDGTRVPQGAFLACPIAGIAGDERFYPEPRVFNPFRFLHEDIAEDEGNNNNDDDNNYGGRKGMGTTSRYALKPNCQVTSPSDTFLGFGYGRHAW